MIKIEYKKINYIFSINNCIEENVKKLSLTEETILCIDKLLNNYENNLNRKILNNMYLDERKKVIENFIKDVPSQLMILRNHLKNCVYCNTISEFDFKFKTIKEDMNRLRFINRG